LAEGHPGLGPGHLEAYLEIIEKLPDDTPRIERLLVYLDRVRELKPPKDLLVIGCGPRPRAVKVLNERRYKVVGIEPVSSFVAAARKYLGRPSQVLEGGAEALPVPTSSQDLIICESVLEHVESPRRALDEMYRVLRAGGIAYLTTTNRLRFSPTGDNGEYHVRFLNWFPRLVRESYVFQHLHQDPALANYSLRPAVHWFTFADLCELGRDSGFAQFYSLLDLVVPDDPSVQRKWWRRLMLKLVQRNAWLRALALTQVGYSIGMLKRP
jgi:ubiquinone/menaquinone biosynthesis C-methylase UbiE